MTPFPSKVEYSDGTTTTSESDSEDLISLFGTASEKYRAHVFTLENGQEYKVNLGTTDMDICDSSRDCEISANDVIMLLNSVHSWPDFVRQLKAIQIICHTMDDRGCQKLIDTMEAMDFDSLEVFSLIGPKMEPATFYRLMAYITSEEVKHLAEFTIGHTYLGDEVFCKAVEELQLGTHDQVHTILFPDVGLTDKSRDLIVAYLKSKRSKNARHISLVENGFSEEAKLQMREAAKTRENMLFLC